MKRWTELETRKALFLYFQLPFGQLHKGTAEIIELAKEFDRTPSSVAMKLSNFASLDPIILESGRKGLSGASALDRKVWQLFQDDWTGQIEKFETDSSQPNESQSNSDVLREVSATFDHEAHLPITSRVAEIKQRIGQGFFRRAVLANFGNRCCITGIAERRLLIASHISSWSSDVANRHNPRNGLCLSATFDKAFDAHLMTVNSEHKVRFSSELLKHSCLETRAFFEPYEGVAVRLPTSIALEPKFLEEHSSKLLP